jgi:multidrug efflux pump
MFSHFFIERPIFASVLSIVITLAGAVAAFTLPVAQYPPITPPSIYVQCTYPGADARVVAESVAAPIEQQVNGVEDMLYMVSQSNNDGSYTLTVTFKPGVNLNFAQVLVQNRINLALPLLPDVVKQAGVVCRKRNPDILLVLGVYSPKRRYDGIYLSNYVTINLRDEIARVEGVGDVNQFGQQDYSMRVWLDPERLAEMNLTAGDVANAVREQNRQVAAGSFGQLPTASGRPFEFPITTLGRLSEPAEFEGIIVRSDPDGRKVRIKDVGRVELGARSLDSTSKLDGQPNASLAVWALPDANSIATADRVIQRMEELKKSFPEDVDYRVSLDMTPFMKESIRGVFRTLIEAVILVAAVVLLFLQNWRSALIPLIAVPVAIIGTFAVMAGIGFTLNNLTLFGLVLAIGIVVDDAIVVVEAVEHHIEEGMSPRAAAHKAMSEVSGPVIAVALVLSAVFVPCAFISGITGMFFRQFALTIAVSTVISAFNSLTLSPALAALLLPRRGAKKDLLGRLLDLILGWFFRIFNWSFRRGTTAYTSVVARALRGSAIVLVVYGGLVGLTWVGFNGLPPSVLPGALRGVKIGSLELSGGLPKGYIPNQDQGRFYIAVQLPDASSMERTQNAVDHIQRLVQPLDGVVHVTEIAGQSFTYNANGSNFGQFFCTFAPFDQRRDPSLSAGAITRRVQELLDMEVPEARASLFTPPAVSGLGSASGFKIIIEDRGDLGLAEIQKQVERVIERSKTSDKVQGLSCIFRANVPQLHADLNREQCETMGVNPKDVFDTLQIYLGSFYVNDFNRFGRTWQVVIQAEGQFRDDPSRVKLLKVRNAQGNMVPLGAVLSIREIGGPINIGRYNMYPAAAILGATKPGISSGQGIEEMERICEEVLPPGMAFEWSEINFMEVDAEKNVWNKLIFPLAVLFVFLVLAAQYESWALPLAVILVVPMCILGSLTGVAVTSGDVNIFTQIGFVVLVGLASKNAILIVEFAKRKYENGMSRHEAALQACKLRLRPILMTSFAFIFGVIPLILGQGAGAEMRRTLGIAVFSGMLGVTLFGIFLTPVFFNVIEWFSDKSGARSRPALRVGYMLRWPLVGLKYLVVRLPAVAMEALAKAIGQDSDRARSMRQRSPRATVVGQHSSSTETHRDTRTETRVNGDEQANGSEDGLSPFGPAQSPNGEEKTANAAPANPEGGPAEVMQ